jgi:hypothetical protein
MPDDTEDATLCARHEVIIKDTEAQVAADRRRVQAAHLLLAEEESKVTALEQTATAARQRVPSSPSSTSSPTVAPPLVPTASSTYEDTVVARLHLQATTVLNVRQLVNIVLDSSSTNYACWRDLMSMLSSATPYSSTSRTTLRPLIRGGFGWTASSSTGSATPSRRIFTRWSRNMVARRATSGSPLRTSFSVTVSTVFFTLMLLFTLLFRMTARSMSTAASSRPRLMV